MPVSEQTTQILVDLGNGDRSAAKRLMPLVYDELRGLAQWYMQQERLAIRSRQRPSSAGRT